ncbi:MAG TPA: DUF4288 domain-containing protein [Armatimonadota bacterium]|nr:DUF4288 domain-containing protein [Armatimonadota bacterium]
MKKAVSILLLGLFLTGLFGCTPAINQQVSPTDTAGDAAGNAVGAIGLSLSADSAFNSDFTAEFTKLSEAGGYKVVTKTAGGDYNKQTEDILALVNAGVKIVVVDPVNIDQMDTAIGEEEDEYQNPYGESVRHKFVEAIDCFIILEETLATGVELYWRILRVPRETETQDFLDTYYPDTIPVKDGIDENFILRNRELGKPPNT